MCHLPRPATRAARSRCLLRPARGDSLGQSPPPGRNLRMDLRDRLQSTLGNAYTVERELGGGGMSRVFLAHETALGRNVVVKVLSESVIADLSAERFAREVRLAASLQHP